MSIHIQPDGRARIHVGGDVLKLRPQDVLELAVCLKEATEAFRRTDVFSNQEGRIALATPQANGSWRVSVLDDEGQPSAVAYTEDRSEADSFLEGLAFERAGHLAEPQTWILGR